MKQERKEFLLKNYPKPSLKEGTMSAEIIERLNQGGNMRYSELIKAELNCTHHNIRRNKNSTKTYKDLIKNIEDPKNSEQFKGQGWTEERLTKWKEDLQNTIIRLTEHSESLDRTLEPGFSQLVARMVAYGQILKIKRGWYRLPYKN